MPIIEQLCYQTDKKQPLEVLHKKGARKIFAIFAQESLVFKSLLE